MTQDDKLGKLEGDETLGANQGQLSGSRGTGRTGEEEEIDSQSAVELKQQPPPQKKKVKKNRCA